MLVDVAAERGIDVTDLVTQILTAPLGDRTICIQFIIDEADVETNLRHRDMMVGSDGIPDLRGRPHPRLFGTFPRVLARYVRERGVLGLERSGAADDVAVRRNVRARRSRPRPRRRLGRISCCSIRRRCSTRRRTTIRNASPTASGSSWSTASVAYDGGLHTGAGAGKMLRYRRSAFE